jgi:RNA polymerase sigma factor (sigma-70 family)
MQTVDAQIKAFEPALRRIASARMRTLPASITLDELVQAGRVAVWRASEKWDGRGDFEAFASERVGWAFKDYLRTLAPGSRHEKSIQFIRIDDAHSLYTMCDETQTDEVLMFERAAVLDALPHPQRAMALHYVMGDDEKTAAQQHGIPHWTWRKQRTRLFEQIQRRGW